MIVYGTEIKLDISLSLDLPSSTSAHYNIELSSKVPAELRSSITCGFPFYQAHGRNVYLYSDRLFDGNEQGQPWCYEVKDVVRFFWQGGKRTIYYELIEQSDVHLLGFWFIHLLLPLFFTLEGMYDFLHAGAVEVDGKAIIFIAPSMGGKSTLTDCFIQQGHVLISDDKVPTFIEDENFMVVGSHPYHRPYRKFEELGLRVDKFTTTCNPIHAFYALERVENGEEPAIEEIRGFEKFDTLLPNYLYVFPFLRRVRLQYLSSMLNQIRAFRVKMPWDLERLVKTHDIICQHIRGVV